MEKSVDGSLMKDAQDHYRYWRREGCQQLIAVVFSP